MDTPAKDVYGNVEVDLDLIRKLDRSGPRYTSYPTADRFVEAFNADAYTAWCHKRNIGGIQRPLSIYVHIPFCNTVCFYCACNKIVTKDRSKAEKYLQYLFKEIEMQAPLFADDLTVTQLHFGGGTPTFLHDDQLEALMAKIRSHFRLVDDGEYSIEIDPRKVDEQTVALLARIGFNRVSLGVQDFDEAVQRAVNRIQSEEETLRVIRAARANCNVNWQGCLHNTMLICGACRQSIVALRYARPCEAVWSGIERRDERRAMVKSHANNSPIRIGRVRL